MGTRERGVGRRSARSALLGVEYAPGVDGAFQYVTLDRCESLTARRSFWGIASTDDAECMPTGEFTFEQSYALPDGEVTWTFTVAVERR